MNANRCYRIPLNTECYWIRFSENNLEEANTFHLTVDPPGKHSIDEEQKSANPKDNPLPLRKPVSRYPTEAALNANRCYWIAATECHWVQFAGPNESKSLKPFGGEAKHSDDAQWKRKFAFAKRTLGENAIGCMAMKVCCRRQRSMAQPPVVQRLCGIIDLDRLT